MTGTSMNIPSRMPILYHWSLNCWTNSRELDNSLNWMSGGDTITFKSGMVINGKQPSKWTKDFLNPQSCSLECATHQRHSVMYHQRHTLPVRSCAFPFIPVQSLSFFHVPVTFRPLIITFRTSLRYSFIFPFQAPAVTSSINRLSS